MVQFCKNCSNPRKHYHSETHTKYQAKYCRSCRIRGTMNSTYYRHCGKAKTKNSSACTKHEKYSIPSPGSLSCSFHEASAANSTLNSREHFFWRWRRWLGFRPKQRRRILHSNFPDWPFTLKFDFVVDERALGNTLIRTMLSLRQYLLVYLNTSIMELGANSIKASGDWIYV